MDLVSPITPITPITPIAPYKLTRSLFYREDGMIKTNLQHELVHPTTTFFTALFPILLKTGSYNIRQIEVLMKNLWYNFIRPYRQKSSLGHLMVGKRFNDKHGTVFFGEMTHQNEAITRVNQWGNRELIFSKECSDATFGELFLHKLLATIRISRSKEKASDDDTSRETEWFKMTGLNWEDVKLIVDQVCIFVDAIKSIRPVTSIDINTVPLNKIMGFPKIGKKIGPRIDEERSKKPFKNFKDLQKRVPKLGICIINALKDFVFFGNGEQGQYDDDLENQPININTASKEDLMDIPKIGDTLATKIVSYRELSRFEKKEDLLSVAGIGQTILDSIKDSIDV